MSHSGVPVVEQIGSAAGSVGSAVGQLINPSSPTATPAPAVASPSTDGAQMQNAEEEEDENAKGQSADIYTSGSGLSTQAPVARNVLMGS